MLACAGCMMVIGAIDDAKISPLDRLTLQALLILILVPVDQYQPPSVW